MSPGPRVPLKGFWPLLPGTRRQRALAAYGSQVFQGEGAGLRGMAKYPGMYASRAGLDTGTQRKYGKRKRDGGNCNERHGERQLAQV